MFQLCGGFAFLEEVQAPQLPAVILEEPDAHPRGPHDVGGHARQLVRQFGDIPVRQCADVASAATAAC